MSALGDAMARVGVGRRVHGIAAALLPYRDGTPDWASFEAHLARTKDAGLGVAVNMDTGFGDLLSAAEREQVLACARATLGAGFYAGAYADADAYRASLAAIASCEAIPVIVQSAGLHGLPPDEKAARYREVAGVAGRALAFELSPVFAPHGEIWDDETFARLLDIPALTGAKHSSLDRATELRRLEARDRNRPDWRVYTGNDMAIDMVLFGSDYLLGLATLAPACFAVRDDALAAGDVVFLTLNDALQHLGNVAFRAPVPAYKHAAAMFLSLIGHLATAEIHPRAPRRPESDVDMLRDCAIRLGLLAP